MSPFGGILRTVRRSRVSAYSACWIRTPDRCPALAGPGGGAQTKLFDEKVLVAGESNPEYLTLQEKYLYLITNVHKGGKE